MTTTQTPTEFAKFYKSVGVVPAKDIARDITTIASPPAGQNDPKGFVIALDGRPVKTPKRAPLCVPTRPLADVLAHEWDSQGDMVRPATMPATRLINVAIDQTPTARDGMIDQLMQYAQTDCVCYLETADQVLRARQDEVWAPLRAWASEEWGIHLIPVQGIVHVDQPQASLDALKALAQTMDDIRLTTVCHAAALLSSAVLAVALSSGHLTAAEAFKASRLEEDFQISRWGPDEEAQARADTLHAQIQVMGHVLRALGGERDQ